MADRERPRLPILRAAGALGAVALAGGVAACGSSSSGSANTITLYNAQHEQTTGALIAAFTKQTGIKVRVLNNSEDVLTAQLVQEGARSPADVVYVENSNWLEQLDQKGMLARLDGPTLAEVPRKYSAGTGDWLGISARVSSLIYNTSKVSRSALPTSILALAQPQWKGKFELAPAETDFWPIVTSVARTIGPKAALTWLKQLKANATGNDSVPDNEALVRDVNDGNTELGVINQYYFFRLAAEVGKGAVRAAVAPFAPRDPGYIEDVSGAAVLKSSRRQTAARQFVQFLASHAGQQVLAAGDAFEYPLAPGVAPNPVLPKLDTLEPAPLTPAQLGTGLDAEQLLREAGLI